MGRPKQFIELLGTPALGYTLRAFEAAPEIRRIYTVGDQKRIRTLAHDLKISKYAGCAEPGETRSHSTMSGLRILDEAPETLVLIHDGSRCLTSPDLIRRVISAAREGTVPDGVVPTLPVSDTIKVVGEDSAVQKTLDRTQLHATQTPQAFRLEVLQKLYTSEALFEGATDDAFLVERSGGEVKTVAGEKTNIKLTSPEDLFFAEAILKVRKDRYFDS